MPASPAVGAAAGVWVCVSAGAAGAGWWAGVQHLCKQVRCSSRHIAESETAAAAAAGWFVCAHYENRSAVAGRLNRQAAAVAAGAAGGGGGSVTFQHTAALPCEPSSCGRCVLRCELWQQTDLNTPWPSSATLTPLLHLSLFPPNLLLPHRFAHATRSSSSCVLVVGGVDVSLTGLSAS